MGDLWNPLFLGWHTYIQTLTLSHIYMHVQTCLECRLWLNRKSSINSRTNYRTNFHSCLIIEKLIHDKLIDNARIRTLDLEHGPKMSDYGALDCLATTARSYFFLCCNSPFPPTPYLWSQWSKQMQLGVPNQIVDNSDFKLADWDRRFWSDLDFKGNFELMITISI